MLRRRGAATPARSTTRTPAELRPSRPDLVAPARLGLSTLRTLREMAVDDFLDTMRAESRLIYQFEIKRAYGFVE